MSAKVTMQDIADALGLSRNTVSKAINNTGVISSSTKELILKKAAEMGYRNITVTSATPYAIKLIPESSSTQKKEIAMLTQSMPGGSHFAVTTLDRMQQIFSHHGYNLTLYRITQEELNALHLPGSFSIDKVAAIFCMEVFDYNYCRMLTNLDIPLLFIDGPAAPDREPLAADKLLMENYSGIYSFVSQIAHRGKKSVGFIGNIKHCRSFFERGSACIIAATTNGLAPAEQYSILSFPPGVGRRKGANYADFVDDLYDMLREMPELPDAFVCANDFIAINLISALRRMKVRCPEDILVMGFDDSPESRFHSPTLTTVHIHTQTMGNLASELILSRIADPTLDFRNTYALTDLILRESSRF